MGCERRFGMGRYIVGRIFWMVPTLILMSLAIFILMHATPGSPFQIGPLDYLSTLLAIFGASVPNFVAAFMLLFLFIVVLPGTYHVNAGFKTTWTGAPKDYILPVMSLAFLPLATITSYTRASMLD